MMIERCLMIIVQMATVALRYVHRELAKGRRPMKRKALVLALARVVVLGAVSAALVACSGSRLVTREAETGMPGYLTPWQAFYPEVSGGIPSEGLLDGRAPAR